MCLTVWARQNVTWWLDLTHEECVSSLSLVPIWKSVRLATDATDIEWGAILAGVEMSDMFNKVDVKRIIAHKEWLAMEFAVRSNLAFLQGRIVTWHIDNQNARLAFINQSCGTSPLIVRVSDKDCPSLREVSSSSSRRLSQQEEDPSRLESSSKCSGEDLRCVRNARDRSDGYEAFSTAKQVLLSSHRGGGIGGGQHGTGLEQVQAELHISSSSHARAGVESSFSVQEGNSISIDNSVETSFNVVSEGSSPVPRGSSQTPSKSAAHSGSSRVIMHAQNTLWKGDEIRRVEAFWWGRRSGGRLSIGAQSIIQSSWAKGTKSVYGLGYRYYAEFCKKHKMDPFEPDPVNLLNFLTYFYEVKKSEYRTLNCYRSAISSTLAPDPRTGIPVGQDPLVSRFF